MASFLQIFSDPAAVFAKVRERGSWAAPLIVMALITMLFSFYVTRTIGMENIMRRYFDENAFFATRIPADKKEEVIQQASTPAAMIRGAFFGGVTVVVLTLIIATIVMTMLSIMERRPQFSRMLGTVAWATFPFTVITCLMGVLILYFSRDPTELDPQTLVATNIGAFLEKKSTSGFLYSLATSFDLIAIGKVLLLSFGISKVSGVVFSRALTLVMGLWIVWVLLRGGIAAATGF
jgi:hypothetical protein